MVKLSDYVSRKKRYAGLDVVKVFACFLVVTLHTCTRNTDVTFSSILYYSSVVAIPLFFMVNGYLLFGRTQKDKWYSYKKIFRILFMVFILNIFVSLFYYLSGKYFSNPFFMMFQGLVFQNGLFGHF
jgi:surface polysaccharide O-acyltransferase-like enzyme